MRATNFNETLLKILLVEATLKDALIIKEHLKSSNYSITVAPELSEALQLLSTQVFDVILLNPDLPGAQGLSALRKIKLAEITLPIIIIANHDDEETALTSVREGAQDYLVKDNLTSENILRVIKLAIERKNILKILKKRTWQFSILSTAIADLSECDNVLSIYRTFCNYVQTLLKDSIVLPIDYSDKNLTYAFSNERIEKYFELIEKTNELNRDQASVYVNTILKEIILLYPDGKLHKMPRDIFEMFSTKYGLSFAPELKNRLIKDEIYAIGIVKDEKHYGGVIIFAQKVIENINIDIVETLSTQVSLNIHKKNVENNLKLSEKQHRSLFAEVKKAKEELQTLNDDLEMKIRIRTNELLKTNSLLKSQLEERKRVEEKLNKYASELKEINATKDKFFGIIAHDLRNPFTSLLGASELLINYVDKFDIDNIKNISMLLSDSAKRGYALLENLLEWSRTQTGSIKFNPQLYDIRDLIAENLNNIEFYRVNKKIKLFCNISEGIQVIVDKNMFNSIMRNLLSNAVKFTHRGGEITVTCEDFKGHFMISVKDNGVGIPKEDMHKLFRIDLRYTNIGTSKERGTGLGLLLCKEFVQKHSGKIWVESSEGKGSEFKFTIPNNIQSSGKPDKHIEDTKVIDDKNQN